MAWVSRLLQTIQIGAAGVVAGASLWGSAAQAVTVQTVQPRGSVSSARQVQVDFAQAVVPLGQPDAAAPVEVQCSSNAAAGGQGRWLNEKRWVFDFADVVVPGNRCSVTANAQFRALDGSAITGFAEHRFETGGPAVQSIQPYTWNDIDESQHFLITTDGIATPQSVLEHTWCEVGDVGERIPVRLLNAEERSQVLRATWNEQDAEKNPQNYIALACQRRLTPGADVKLVWGAGIASPVGVATKKRETFDYTVRKPFTAVFTCQREKADKKCIPILPMRVDFSAEFDSAWLSKIKLVGAGKEWPAVVAADDTDEAQAQDAQAQQDGQAAPAAPQLISQVVFAGPFPEDTQFRLEIPADLKDDADRPLSNAAAFPLSVATEQAPPLAKFASNEFGIVEQYGEGRDSEALLPVTLRRVEAELPVKILHVKDDLAIMEWMGKMREFNPDWTVSVAKAREAGVGPILQNRDRDRNDYQSGRTLSLLNNQPAAQNLSIPAPKKDQARKETEVVGIPLQAGYQVVEIASPILGQALVGDAEYTPAPQLFARTAALVTNWSVHFKYSPLNAMAWVTSLDDGRPVAGANVKVYNCSGDLLDTAQTDSQGQATFQNIQGQAPRCDYRSDSYFVVARSQDNTEMGLVWSDWYRGIEPWRFQVPYAYMGYQNSPNVIAHTVTDRSLLRAGETVSMKHYLRTETLDGFGNPSAKPAQVLIRHQGSGQEFTQELSWQGGDAQHGLRANSSFVLPKLAPLGIYTIELRDGEESMGYCAQNCYESGSFRVEEFRLPLMQGSMAPVGDATLVHTDKVDMNVQLNYVAGGAAANWPVQVSALIEPAALDFDRYSGYSFNPPLSEQERIARDEGSQAAVARRLLMDKKPLALNAQGNARVTLDGLGLSNKPQSLRTEVTYADPNGEMQTLSNVRTIWPAEVLVGLKTENWISVSKPLKVQAIVLSPEGAPVKGVAVKVQALSNTTLTTRKRMVGGFYKYDHQYQTKDLGTVCTGTSDASGRVECTVNLTQPGEVELVATVADSAQRTSQATSSVWVTRGQMWFDAQASDRMDVLPEKPFYEPGETARFQVRMPFRKAQAWVSIEREGIVSTQVIELSGDDPSFTLKVADDWSPNMAVSVLAVRGRLREVPWYSFFTWGFKSPIVWWRAWREDTGEEAPAPTAMVDLSKPAFRMGVASIKVGQAGHKLDVQVQADKKRYDARGTAKVEITVKLPNGKPAAGADVAIAAVDKALLELAPNNSWDLLKAMMRQRDWSVVTATAQMEVLGRRHYGRKAVAAGGGGGADGMTRELFDTLAYWNPSVTLDANGKAVVEVPLNDSLTTFQVEVIADAGLGFFGNGHVDIQVAQDLQIISGLPPVVREGDVFDAGFTIRNTTEVAQSTTIEAQVGEQTLPAQTVEIAAGSAAQVQWRVTAPQLQGLAIEAVWKWNLKATNAKAKDAMAVTQTVLPAVPVTVRQASMRQLDGDLNLLAAMPKSAIDGRGGLQIDAQSTLYSEMPMVLNWWLRYPYACLEQRYSKSVGLMDAELWDRTAQDLPAYLDSDGLASYFPVNAYNRGSPVLTAYLLSADATLSKLGEDKQFRIDDASRQRMIEGLTAYVQGNIERSVWSDKQYRALYRLNAIAALALQGQAQASMLESISINPARWPTHSLIDWMQILKNMPRLAGREQYLEEVQSELRSRLVQTGVQMLFTTERSDDWWWAMQNGDVNAARILLVTADMPEWKDDMGALASGLVARQSRGAWSTTVANFWGPLALKYFSKLHESEPVVGALQASYGGVTKTEQWPAQKAERANDAAFQRANTSAAKLSMNFAWPDAIARLGDPEGSGQLSIAQQGTGKPWVTIASLAAVALETPVSSGLQIKKTVTPVSQAVKGQWSKGDVYRVRLEVKANAEVGMTALTDPIPSGSTILGSGLGRDSAMETESESDDVDRYGQAYVERKMDVMRVYYYFLPEGVTTYEYTVRLNQPGEFYLPPTRAEALYMPQVFAETPNKAFSIAPQPQASAQ